MYIFRKRRKPDIFKTKQFCLIKFGIVTLYMVRYLYVLLYYRETRFGTRLSVLRQNLNNDVTLKYNVVSTSTVHVWRGHMSRESGFRSDGLRGFAYESLLMLWAVVAGRPKWTIMQFWIKQPLDKFFQHEITTKKVKKTILTGILL